MSVHQPDSDPVLPSDTEALPDPADVELTAAYLADFLRNEALPEMSWLASIIEADSAPNAAAAIQLLLTQGDEDTDDALLAVTERVVDGFPKLCDDYQAFTTDQCLPAGVPDAAVLLGVLREHEDPRYWPAVTAFATGAATQCLAACSCLAEDTSERSEALLRRVVESTHLAAAYQALVNLYDNREDVGWARAAAMIAAEPGWDPVEREALLSAAAEALDAHEAQWGELLDEETVLEIAEDVEVPEQVREIALACAMFYLVDDEETARMKAEAKNMVGNLHGMFDRLAGMTGMDLPFGTDDPAERDQEELQRRINDLAGTGLVALGDLEKPNWFTGQLIALRPAESPDSESAGAPAGTAPAEATAGKTMAGESSSVETPPGAESSGHTAPEETVLSGTVLEEHDEPGRES